MIIKLINFVFVLESRLGRLAAYKQCNICSIKTNPENDWFTEHLLQHKGKYMDKLATLRTWRSCLLLLLLGMISIALGSLQLNSISQGQAQGTYSTMPLPVVVHILFGIIFNVLSPFQFAPSIRKNHPKFHRYSGRLLVLSAIPVAFSALWMNQYFPSYGGTLKYTGIIAYCIVLLGSLFLAIKYVVNKDIQNHRLWMMRAMAAALGPATQRLIIIPIVLVFGEEVVTDRVIGLLIWSGILINLAFVEYLRFKERRFNPQKSKSTAECQIHLDDR